jgi:hypothetical protein
MLCTYMYVCLYCDLLKIKTAGHGGACLSIIPATQEAEAVGLQV